MPIDEFRLAAHMDRYGTVKVSAYGFVSFLYGVRKSVVARKVRP
jgi:hypothetical protein